MRIHLPSTSNLDTASKYLNILQAFHNLKGQSFDLLSMMIADYIEYRDEANIKNDVLIFDLILGTKSKTNYKTKLNISDQRLQNLISLFRKHGILTTVGGEERINKSLIPDIDYKLDFTVIKQY